MQLLKIITLCLLLGCFKTFSQEALQITYSRFGAVKRFRIFPNEVLQYKEKGQLLYHKNKIVDLQDSAVFFTNGTDLALNRIKSIKLRTGSHFIGTLEQLCLIGGIGLFSISAFDNAIFSRSPVFNEKISYISGAMVVTGILIREIAIKRIRINKRKELKIVDLNYDNLNSK